jgi:hypothetical protein
MEGAATRQDQAPTDRYHQHRSGPGADRGKVQSRGTEAQRLKLLPETSGHGFRLAFNDSRHEAAVIALNVAHAGIRF